MYSRYDVRLYRQQFDILPFLVHYKNLQDFSRDSEAFLQYMNAKFPELFPVVCAS